MQSKSGITVLAGTLTLKGVMWIVPIAHIKKIFTKEYSHVTRERDPPKASNRGYPASGRSGDPFVFGYPVATPTEKTAKIEII